MSKASFNRLLTHITVAILLLSGIRVAFTATLLPPNSEPSYFLFSFTAASSPARVFSLRALEERTSLIADVFRLSVCR